MGPHPQAEDEDEKEEDGAEGRDGVRERQTVDKMGMAKFVMSQGSHSSSWPGMRGAEYAPNHPLPAPVASQHTLTSPTALTTLMPLSWPVP